MKPARSRLPEDKSLLEFSQHTSHFTFARMGQLSPTLIVRQGRGVEIYVTDKFRSHQDKDAWESFILEVTKQADEIVLVTEAWVRIVTGESAERVYEDQLKKYKTIPGYTMESEPDRKEVIHIVHATPEKEVTYYNEIFRVADRSPMLSEWKEVDMSTAKISKGRFVNLLQRAQKHKRN